MNVRGVVVLLSGCFLSALLGAGAAYYVLQSPSGSPISINPGREELRLRTFASSAPTSFIEAAESTTPAVVAIRTYLRSGLSDGVGVETVKGSAVLISADGYLVTNNHVIEGGSRIRVTLGDRREYDAEIVGVDAPTDLALLKIEADELPYLSFGNSDSLRVGEWVLAVGNPFGLKSTVTAGIVSAKGRSIDVLSADDRIESFIQSDAAVNPGNSGGALINTAGELIGINTAIITNSGRHEGYAFAIPGNLARRVINDLRDYGEVKRAILGVWIQGINDAQARSLKLPSTEGALITDLTPGGPAMLSGLELGDVMTAINGNAINSSAEMQEQLSRYRPGQRIRVTYIRNSRERRLTVLLRDKRNQPSRRLVSERDDDILHRLGLEARTLTPSEQSSHPAGGVKVVAVFRNSTIETTNMKPGFIITSVNHEPLYNIHHLVALLRDRPGGLLFGGVYDGYEGEYFYQLPATTGY